MYKMIKHGRVKEVETAKQRDKLLMYGFKEVVGEEPKGKKQEKLPPSTAVDTSLNEGGKAEAKGDGG